MWCCLVFKHKVLKKKQEGSKVSEGKVSLPVRSADKILKESKEDSQMKRILEFMKGTKPEPDEIFDGDYLRGEGFPKGTGFKLK